VGSWSGGAMEVRAQGRRYSPRAALIVLTRVLGERHQGVDAGIAVGRLVDRQDDELRGPRSRRRPRPGVLVLPGEPVVHPEQARPASRRDAIVVDVMRDAVDPRSPATGDHAALVVSTMSTTRSRLPLPVTPATATPAPWFSHETSPAPEETPRACVSLLHPKRPRLPTVAYRSPDVLDRTHAHSEVAILPNQRERV